MSDCPFCIENIPEDRIIVSNPYAYAVESWYAVVPGHSLIIPKRHIDDYFFLSDEELIACDRLLCNMRDLLRVEDPDITGFNIGMNCGVSAGQTIMHAHIHLIPRRDGDVENPRGGVRNIIPGKGDY